MDMYLLWVRRNVSNKSAMCEHSLRFTPPLWVALLGLQKSDSFFFSKEKDLLITSRSYMLGDLLV